MAKIQIIAVAVFIAFLAILIFVGSCGRIYDGSDCEPFLVEGRIVVIFNETVTSEQFLAFNKKYNLPYADYSLDQSGFLENKKHLALYDSGPEIDYFIGAGMENATIKMVRESPIVVDARQAMGYCGK